MKNFLALLALCLCFSCSYLPEEIDAHADLLLEETPDYISLSPINGVNKSTGIVFYPGGLVDPHAYIESFKDFVITDERQVVIMKVSANLAILNNAKAHSYIDHFEDVTDWVIGGHSLGGSVACMDAASHQDAYKGLFVLDAYSVSDLSSWQAPVMVITASFDPVEDKKYIENEGNLPPRLDLGSISDIPSSGSSGQTLTYNIFGANHAQFGNYGVQKGDNVAKISAKDQQSFVRDLLRAFFIANNLL